MISNQEGIKKQKKKSEPTAKIYQSISNEDRLKLIKYVS